AEAIARVAQAQETGGFEGEWRGVWPGGTGDWLAGRGSFLKGGAGEPPRLIGINIYNTEGKEGGGEGKRVNTRLAHPRDGRNSELQAANKELEAFSYSVSHDLRAPLRAIDGFSRILVKQHADQMVPEAQEFLHLIRDNAQQMGQLVDDLLAFSRLSRQPIKR